MSLAPKDKEFWQLFHEGEAEYRRSRGVLKNDPRKPRAWEDITPLDLRPAIKYLRQEFAAEQWKLSIKAECGCYVGLHPQLATLPKVKAGLKNLIPVGNRNAWQQGYEGLKESETFKMWCDEISEGLAELIVGPFGEFLKIGLVQKQALPLAPVEWSQEITADLIYGLGFTLPHLIKDMCDEQQHVPTEDLTTENFGASCAWVYWRAPRFVHMQPSGNSPYNSETAWERESAERTEQLLRALTERILEFPRFKLKKLAGQAHVSLASTTALVAAPTGGVESNLGYPDPGLGSPKGANLRNALEPPQQDSPSDMGGDSLSARTMDSSLNYRSDLKRAILVQLIRSPQASDLQICRGLDGDGAVDLPSGWSVSGNRLFESAYKDSTLRPRIQAAISKIRADLRAQRLRV